MKMKPLPFEEDLKPIEVYDIMLKIEDSLYEINEYEWQYSFGSDSDRLNTVEDLLSEADFDDISCVTDLGWYWFGVLTAEPWDDLGKGEETILNLIKKYHLSIDTSEGIKIVFRNNTKSPLYRFFLKHKDGYGGNIAYSIRGMMSILSKWIEKQLKDHLDRYGSWEEVGPYVEEENEEVDEEVD